ncbi:MAG: NAD(P)H-dependent oxidoreductase [Opitutaceae bacterium]|nr:NAD(P)H-dependent oxidoreductase [Opitutaceae bacterium]
MADLPRILAFSGSIRKASVNTQLLHVAAAAVQRAGGQSTLLSLQDYPLPLFNGDLENESGMPDPAKALVEALVAHDGLLIACPEYNSMVTPLLKNTIDWCSRADDNPFEGKVVAVVSASPGAFGGVRSLTAVRQMMTHLGAWVVPVACSVAQADKAFDPHGQLINPRTQKTVDRVALALIDLCRKLKGQ